MEIKRTANAGVLLKLDGVSILLDGICGELSPYLATPEDIRQEFTLSFPDVLAFTHHHPDHYDGEYAKAYRKITGRPVLEPPMNETVNIGSVRIRAYESRHIGKTDVPHISFIITGSRCVWFLGDASPNAIRKLEGLPSPDVIVVPYAYANTVSAFNITKKFGAEHIIVLHLPDKSKDMYKICETVEKVVGDERNIHMLKMGKTIIL